jgi:transketolase
MTIKNTYDFGQAVIKESNQVNFSLDFSENDNFTSIRDAYAYYIKKILIKNSKYVLLDADLGTVAKTNDIKKKINNRYIQVGIAEQNLIGIAAGIAQYKKIPIVQSLAVFLTGRAFDQIRESVCYSNLNVKLIGLHSGMTLSPDGATHQTGEDIALISSLPNIEIYTPTDSHQLKALLPEFLKSKKPGYLRLFFPKALNLTKGVKYSSKKVQIIKRLEKINIISYGYMLQNSMQAIELLKKKKIDCGLVNIHCIKPLDIKGILEISKKSKLLVVIEDHNKFGGLGSIIAQAIAEKKPNNILSINSNDKFGKTGLPEENLDYLGLSSKKIVKNIIKYLNIKK